MAMGPLEIRFPRDKARAYVAAIEAGAPLPAARDTDDLYALIGAALMAIAVAGRPRLPDNLEQREAKYLHVIDGLLTMARCSADLVGLVMHPAGFESTAPTVRVVVEHTEAGWRCIGFEGIDTAVMLRIAGLSR